MPPCFGSFLLCVCRLSSSGLLMEMRPVIWIKNVFDWIPVLQGNFECCHLPPRPVPVFPPTIRHDSPANNRITVLLIEWSIPRSLAKDRAIQPPSWPSLLRGRTHTHTRSLSHTHTLPPPTTTLSLTHIQAPCRCLVGSPGRSTPSQNSDQHTSHPMCVCVWGGGAGREFGRDSATFTRLTEEQLRTGSDAACGHHDDARKRVVKRPPHHPVVLIAVVPVSVKVVRDRRTLDPGLEQRDDVKIERPRHDVRALGGGRVVDHVADRVRIVERCERRVVFDGRGRTAAPNLV